MEAWIPPHKARGRSDRTQTKMATTISVSFILRVWRQWMQATMNVCHPMEEEDMSPSAAGHGSRLSVSVWSIICILPVIVSIFQGEEIICAN